MSRRFKSFLAWISIANTYFSFTWHWLTTAYFTPSPAFLAAAPIYGSLESTWIMGYALLFSIFATGLTLFLGEQLIHKIPGSANKIVHAGYCVLSAALTIQLTRSLVQGGFSPRGILGGFGWSGAVLWLFYLSLHFGLLGFFFYWMKQPNRAMRIFHASCIMLLPLLLIRVGLLGRRMYEEKGVTPARVPSSESSIARARVIVVILDRWDYALSFLNRPSDLELPNLDALATSSVFFENAYPPATYTSPSLFSFLMEKPLQRHVRWTKDRNFAYLVNGETVERSLDPSESLFARFAESGYSSSLVGFYLPYCRLFRPFLKECLRYPHLEERALRSSGVFFDDVKEILRTLDPVRGSLIEESAKNAESLIRDSIRVIREGRADFTYLHFPFPHPPWIYDRAQQKIVPAGTPGIDYRDALALADKTVGSLREAIEASGKAEDTVLIVTADHANYEPYPFVSSLDERVPLLIHFPEASHQLRVSGTYNTFRLGRLIFSLLQEGIPPNAEIPAWIDRHLTHGMYPLH